MKLLHTLRRLALAPLFWLPLASFAQTPTPAQPETVFAGVPQETIAGEAPAFQLFDQKFYDNQLFLLGEAHGVQRPQELDFALLQHLNQRAGVRTYVAEVDCAKAYYLNEYLRTGNEATLDLIFRSWLAETSQWANQDFRAKLRRIRAWNLTLPATRKVRFLGLDQLQDLPLAADYLAALLRKSPPSQSLRPQLDSVVTMLRQPTASPALVGLARRALTQPNNSPASADLRHLLLNLTYPLGSMRQREQNIFINLEALYQTKQLTNEKLYGMWGLAHVLQSPLVDGYPSFAARIQLSSLPLRNRVASVLCVFSGCQMLYATAGLPAPWQTAGHPYSSTDKFNHDGPLVVLDGLAELKQRTAPGSSTLFRLDAPGATSTRQPIRLQYAPGMPPSQQMQFSPQVPAAAYVQYLLLVRDSGPVRPLLPAAAAGAVGRR
ncbi:erythromycin esterase family protein [Hymenobacter siberiensis]|uniref:erythromycin esterase family protein n=1 Tax=Hymenobacter siberiensis TaxID=2848396 RepID=UPI001C1DEC62|nr:erythromycin esterase family protein [Hymenobacter siberiensis]MBU6120082.1 erythromycin esterase family protein [Hymenobacter siberiensis]